MARADRNRPEKANVHAEKCASFIVIPKTAFDPGLASLFASSVRLHHLGNFRAASSRDKRANP